MEQVPLCGYQFGGANLALSPCQKLLAMGGGDTQYGPRRAEASEIIVWELATRSTVWYRMETGRGPVDQLRWSPDGSLIGSHVAGWSTIEIYDIQVDARIFQLDLGNHIISDFRFVTRTAVLVATMHKGHCFLHWMNFGDSTDAAKVSEITLPSQECSLHSVLRDPSLRRSYVFVNDYEGCTWAGWIDDESSQVNWDCRVPGVLMNAVGASAGLIALGGSNGKTGAVAVLRQSPFSLVKIANPRSIKEINAVSVSCCGGFIAVSDDARSVRVLDVDSLKESVGMRSVGERIAGVIGVAFCATAKQLAYSQACGFGDVPAVAEIATLP